MPITVVKTSDNNDCYCIFSTVVMGYIEENIDEDEVEVFFEDRFGKGGANWKTACDEQLNMADKAWLGDKTAIDQIVDWVGFVPPQRPKMSAIAVNAGRPKKVRVKKAGSSFQAERRLATFSDLSEEDQEWLLEAITKTPREWSEAIIKWIESGTWDHVLNNVTQACSDRGETILREEMKKTIFIPERPPQPGHTGSFGNTPIVKQVGHWYQVPHDSCYYQIDRFGRAGSLKCSQYSCGRDGQYLGEIHIQAKVAATMVEVEDPAITFGTLLPSADEAFEAAMMNTLEQANPMVTVREAPKAEGNKCVHPFVTDGVCDLCGKTARAASQHRMLRGSK